MSKRAEIAQANAQLPESIMSYAKEHTVMAGLVYREGVKFGYEQAEKDLGWISVKDRLPKEGHFVLTCIADTGLPQCVGMALLLKDGTWWDGDIKVRVDYWMEVPKLKK